MMRTNVGAGRILVYRGKLLSQIRTYPRSLPLLLVGKDDRYCNSVTLDRPAL
jgi:hypothetical protein